MIKRFEIRVENDEYILYDTQLDLEDPLPLAKISYDCCNQRVAIIPIQQMLDMETKKFYYKDFSEYCGRIDIEY